MKLRKDDTNCLFLHRVSKEDKGAQGLIAQVASNPREGTSEEIASRIVASWNACSELSLLALREGVIERMLEVVARLTDIDEHPYPHSNSGDFNQINIAYETALEVRATLAQLEEGN